MTFYKKLSLRRINIAILGLLGLSAIAVSFVSSGYFFNAARHAQTSNVKNTLQLVTKEVMNKAHENSIELAHSLAQNKYLQKTMQHIEQTDSINKMPIILDEPFSGFDPINTELIKQDILRLKK